MRVTWALFLLVLAAMAGCSGGASSGDEDEGTVPRETFDDFDLDATETTGIIRGVVFDEAIRPLEGAKVSLPVPGEDVRKATTSATGAFGFDGLEPGTYFLKVERLGYRDAQRSVEVVAGDDEPEVTKVLLEADPANVPYSETRVWEGFIECSGTFVVVGFAACSAPNIVSQFLGLGNVTNDNFLIEYELTQEPSWIQSEMLWDSTQALGDEMALMYSWDCGDENGGFLCDHEVDGESPLLLIANETAVGEIAEGNLGNGTPLMLRVFNTGLDETMGRVGLTVEQEFEVYTHTFYGYAPPEGWRFTVDGTPPGPE